MSKVLIADLSDGYTEADNLSIDDSAFWLLMRCVPLSTVFPATTVAIRSKGLPRDYFEVGSMIVVSQRLKQTLESFKVNAEFFKIDIHTAGDVVVSDDYYCCNILDCVDCFDYSRGKCGFHTKPGYSDRIDGIQQLAIDETVAASHLLFRIAKGAEYIVCVNDQLADSLAKRGFTGCKCIFPQEWYFGC